MKMAREQVIFRPHFKTHQSQEIGRWFRDYQIDKITVSSLRMAMYFAVDGWNDITVAFPVNLLEKDIINDLSSRLTLNLIAEDPIVLQQLDHVTQHRVGIFLKIDTGTHRTGLDPEDIASVDECVRAIAQSRHLVWRGFLSHAGHTYQVRHQIPDIRKIYENALAGVVALRDNYKSQYPDLLISFGDTPGASMIEDFNNIDEMRPGNFVFYDIMQEQIGSCSIDDIGVALICPVVVEHPERQECVIYGGGIHLSKDSILRDDHRATFGSVVPYSQGRWEASQEQGFVRTISQEHGMIQKASNGLPIKPGQLVAILPVHSCMTAQCMGAYVDSEGNRIDHFASSRYYLQ
jgi:D-serine deaminase-like pyridoxal phosphate-dependent protein